MLTPCFFWVLAAAAYTRVSCNVQTGGPHWDVEAGRLDGTTSSAAVAQATLPTQTDDVAALAARFRKFMGLSLDDMVTLSGNCRRTACLQAKLFPFFTILHFHVAVVGDQR